MVKQAREIFQSEKSELLGRGTLKRQELKPLVSDRMNCGSTKREYKIKCELMSNIFSLHIEKLPMETPKYQSFVPS